MTLQFIRRHRSPDAGLPAGESPETDAATDRSLPKSLADLAYLAGKVSDKWTASPEITMVDTTAAEFAATTGKLQVAAAARNAAGGGRPAITLSLEQLDQQAATGVKKLKTYLVGKFEDEAVATANYARYGIVNESGNYRLPADRQARLTAIDMTLAALPADGLDSKEYGADWWTAYKTNLGKALDQAAGSDAAVSGGVAEIAGLEAQVRYVLTGLRYILRGNYQKTYRQVWREWGFQAEDY